VIRHPIEKRDVFKKYYLLGVASYLLIPAVVLLGGTIFSSINPEIAAGYPNYERNYRLLNLARNLSFFTAFLMNTLLWLLTCFFLLKSKERSYLWLLLAALGPFGFIVLTMLRDNAPARADLHQQFIQRQKLYLRIAYETIFFVAVWFIAYQLVVLKRNVLIMYEAATTGISVAQIIDQQNASSGMWALSEGLEELYLVVIFYLLWPIGFNVIARLFKLLASSRET
jgi:hypothetical protein